MPKLVDREELPCQYRGAAKSARGVPACSGSVSHRLISYYWNHPQAYRPKWADTIDEALVCEVHADWHSQNCQKFGLQRTVG